MGDIGAKMKALGRASLPGGSKGSNASGTVNNNIIKGYSPKPGERTLKGFLKNNVNVNKEISLFTDSLGFNNNHNGTGGYFKRFGAGSHAGLNPHVHQPTRNVAPNGNIFGGTGSKTSNGGVISPTSKDIKQLYEYIYNHKYRP